MTSTATCARKTSGGSWRGWSGPASSPGFGSTRSRHERGSNAWSRGWALRRSRCDMSKPLYPSLYQINTRVWLTELSRALGRPATLDDIPDAELDRLAAMGFDWIWMLSV